MIYGTMTYEQARKTLLGKRSIPEMDYLEAITGYFDNISDRSSFSTYRKIFNSMKTLKYDSSDHSVSSFKIIEESLSTSPVFIELCDEEVILKTKYHQKILGELSKEEWDLNYKNSFQQRIIAVPDLLTKDLDFLHPVEEKIKIVPQPLVAEFYNIETGYIRDMQEKTLMF